MAEYPKVATITLHTVPRCYLLGSARPIDFNVSLKRESNASALVPIRKSSIAVLSSPLNGPRLTNSLSRGRIILANSVVATCRGLPRILYE